MGARTPINAQSGFTLLEVLIAITITALIGIGSSQLLSMAIKTNEQTEAKLKEFRELQKTVLFIGRDFQQILPRAIRDEFGDYQAAVRSSDRTYSIEFSRTGWRNPLGDPRSDIQRVAYELRDGELYRHYWGVLDRAQDSQSVERVLLKDVEEFSVQYRNMANAWVDEWPPELTSENEDRLYEFQQLPKAVNVRLTSPKFGEINRVFDLPLAHQATSISSNDGDGNGENSENNQSGENSQTGDNDNNQNTSGGETNE